MIVRMMSHSKAVQRTSHMAARRMGLVPDRKKRELGSSALRSTPGIGLRRRGIPGAASDLGGSTIKNSLLLSILGPCSPRGS